MKTRRVLGVVVILFAFLAAWRATRLAPDRPATAAIAVAATAAPAEAPEASALAPAAIAANAPREAWTGVFSPVNFEAGPPSVGRVVRETLTPEELSAPQPVTFDLPLRNREELFARVHRGEVISPAELQARYLPLPQDWARVAAWAAAQGLVVKEAGFSRLNVATRGTVAQVETALQMKFGRVIGTDGQEYTSAITAPAVPRQLKSALMAVSELQPHFRLLPSTVDAVERVGSLAINPKTIAALYNATGLGLDGTGQTIVVLGGYRVADEDLTQFWQECGLPTTLAQVTRVHFYDWLIEGEHLETTMDVQWASAMAPKADLVILSTIDPSTYGPWIVDQIAGGRSIGQVTCSAGLTEALSWPELTLKRDEQYYAVLAALGVTLFNSSGDSGSTQDVSHSTIFNRGYYDQGVLAPEYPGTSPFVTSVGGTTVKFGWGILDNQWVPDLPVTEVAWTLPREDAPGDPEYRRSYASGGGVSWYFDRPSWQTGTGVPEGRKRCVPDVAAVAHSNFLLHTRWHGSQYGAGGTSLSAPIWAGLCALINQARANEGRGTLGLLGPRIYPLLNTPCFTPMEFGFGKWDQSVLSSESSNGAYKVGPSYTMITGVGSPNMPQLVAALKTAGPVGTEVLSGIAKLSVRPPTFDAAGYLGKNPEVAANIGDVPDKFDRAWAHYVENGIYEGRTDGDFDVRTYMAQYPEMAARYGTVHLEYIAKYWYWYGRTTGQRIPQGFDVAGYLARNGDVATMYGNDQYGAWLHYYNNGVFEGRSFDANFIPAEYLELNPDLKTVFGSNLQAAVMHWFNYGHPIEDRMGRVPIGFNVDSYLARYPDLNAVFGAITPTAVRNVTVWHHYLAYGTLEGRSDGDFEAYHYLATNPDLNAIFGTDIQAAALHWYFYGRREGRRIPGGFNVQNYRSLYPDVVLVFGDDLYGSWIHYRDNGVFEGRVYDDLFRPADYLSLNPDVAAAIGTNYRDALLHWLYYGQYEGRSGKL